MSDHDDNLTAQEITARDAVRSLADVKPDPAFRERLKSGFAAGTLESAPRLSLIESKPRRRGWFVWGAVAAAAAVALVVWAMGFRPSVWKISGVSGEGIASVNGQSVSMHDMARSAGIVKAGARISMPESGEFQITRDGVTIFISPGTDMRVPVETRDGSGVVYSGTVAMGELRITTGPAFQGNRLEIETPETRVHVTGTTLAIIRGPGSTCVCVLEGTVFIRARSGALMPVEGGRRGTFLPGKEEAEFGEILSMEKTKLSMFREQAR